MIRNTRRPSPLAETIITISCVLTALLVMGIAVWILAKGVKW